MMVTMVTTKQRRHCNGVKARAMPIWWGRTSTSTAPQQKQNSEADESARELTAWEASCYQ